MSFNKNLIPAIMLTFVNVLGFSILIPVLPFIVEQYELSQIWFGILLSAYAAALFFGAPFLGSLSDNFGRKPMLIISHLGTLFSWFIFAIAYFIPTSKTIFSLPLAIIIILISRLLDGITGGNNSIVSALITDVTKPEERGKAFGLVGATFGVGFMFGPLLGGLSSQTSIGYLGTIILAIIISSITLIALIKYVKDPNQRLKEKNWLKISLKKLNIFKTLYSYRKKEIIRSILGIKLFVTLAMSGFTSIISLYLIDRFSLGSSGVGVFMFVIGIYSIINQGVLVPKIIDHLKEPKTLLVGSLILSLGLFVVSFAPTIIIFAIISYLFSLGIATTNLTLKTMLSNISEQKEQGQILGLHESLQSLGHAIMPLFSSILYVAFGNITFIAYSVFILITTIPLTVMIIKKWPNSNN